MSTEQVTTGRSEPAGGQASSRVFETRDFYLACFLRCLDYELLDLRSAGRRRIFVFRDSEARRGHVLAFYGNSASVSPRTFSSTIKDMKAMLYNA